MRHSGLDGDKIRRLVGEADKLAGTYGILNHMIDELEEWVLPKFAGGKRLGDGIVKELVEGMQIVSRQYLTPIEEDFIHRPATLARPKGEEMGMAFLVAQPITGVPRCDDLYQLMSFRAHATRRAFRLDIAAHPFAFQYHTAERMMERLHEADATFRLSATDLSNWSPALAHLDRSGEENPNFVFPSADGSGLHLGEFIDHDIATYASIEYNVHGKKVHHYGTARASRLYVARTFVDRYQLREEQTAAAEALARWRQESGAAPVHPLLWKADNAAVVDLTQDEADTFRSVLGDQSVRAARKRRLAIPALSLR